MNRLFVFAFVFLIFTGMSSSAYARAIGDYPQLTVAENQRIHSQLEDEVSKAENTVKRLVDELKEPGLIHTAAMKRDFQLSVEMYQVKSILANEFRQKMSLRSPLVRNTLLRVMRLHEINEADLKNLQSVVDQEKPRIRDYDRVQRSKVQK